MAKRRNRKKQSAGFIFPAPLAGVLVFVAAVSLVYLWLSGRCEAMGSQIKSLEDRKVELQKRVVSEEYKWATMKSPANIERLLRQYAIEMTWPEKGHVVQVRMQEQSPAPVQVAARVRGYRQENGIMMND